MVSGDVGGTKCIRSDLRRFSAKITAYRPAMSGRGVSIMRLRARGLEGEVRKAPWRGGL